MAIKHVGDALFVDTEPLSGFENIYPYVHFNSLERAYIGVFMPGSGLNPTANPRSWADSEEVSRPQMYENVAPIHEFSTALDAFVKGDEWVFEEEPAIEVGSKSEFTALESAAGFEGHWEGKGIYDGRDLTKMSDSAEQYELDSMEWWVDQTIEAAWEYELTEAAQTLASRI